MTFYERVKSLCEQRGISISKLVSDLGYSKSTGTSWKASSNMPRPGTIKKVADYLGMTIDELKSGIDYIDYDNIDTSGFNQPVFRHLLEQHGGNEKKAIKAYLDFEKAQAQDALSEQSPVFQNDANNIHNSNVVRGDDEPREPTNISAVLGGGDIYNIPVFESVSAGFGAYACDAILEYIPVIITNPSDVEDTIAIKVKGDSMYPKIEDGDIIVVRRQTSVDSGDIAVVLLDGDEGLVKRVVYGSTWIELRSINNKYPVQRFDGTEVTRLRVVGKVTGSYKKF